MEVTNTRIVYEMKFLSNFGPPMTIYLPLLHTINYPHVFFFVSRSHPLFSLPLNGLNKVGRYL